MRVLKNILISLVGLYIFISFVHWDFTWFYDIPNWHNVDRGGLVITALLIAAIYSLVTTIIKDVKRNDARIALMEKRR